MKSLNVSSMAAMDENSQHFLIFFVTSAKSLVQLLSLIVLIAVLNLPGPRREMGTWSMGSANLAGLLTIDDSSLYTFTV